MTNWLVTRVRDELAPDPSLDSQEVVQAALNLVSTAPGSRPGRVVVGPCSDGIKRLNRLHESVQAEMLQ
ncbi:hypothetical protein [Qingshengfaniella alkalisoli]|uniref:Uncharacterized protein n=1 Tax=Qingshengfaniella alkalisoli TaxID=2599296 RepID=A0A5B8IZK6_9RHOB|nr:hypothetical protein [Qingshengfaniella alkalisoli]QDY70381.1 hypothetical protein FPZ52_11670 [Qingshengfaniella alkalisoli]